MTLTLINKTYYKNIHVCIDDKGYRLKAGENIIKDVPQEFKLAVKILDENKVNIAWLWVLLDHFIDSEGIFAHIHCNSFYDIVAQNDMCNIILNDLDAISMPEHCPCKFHSVFLETDGATVNSVNHVLTDCKKVKKKFISLELLLAGCLPLLILFIILYVVTLDSLFITLCLVSSLFFFFSVNTIKKTLKCFNDTTANLSLCEAISDRLQHEKTKKNKQSLIKRFLNKYF